MSENVQDEDHKAIPPKGFRKLEPIVVDILELYGHIRATFATVFREKLKGWQGIKELKGEEKASKSGRVTKETPEFEKYGTQQDVYFVAESNDALPVQGVVMPILSAFRALIEIGPDSFARWTCNPRRIYDLYGQDFIRTIMQASRDVSRNPNAVGKSKSIWGALYADVKWNSEGRK